MRKTIVILLSIAVFLSLVGCQITSLSSSQTESSSSIFSSPSSVSLTSSKTESASSSEETDIMNAPNGTPEDHITYLHLFWYYCLSYMKQGNQALSGNGDDLDVDKITEDAPDEEDLIKYYVTGMYQQGSVIPTYEKYYEHPALTNEFVSSNGDWDFFPIKVRYEEYTLENQPNKPEWDQYFMSRIKTKSDVTPLVYVDAWFFDWNQDGIEDAFVNASNIFYSHEDVMPNLPFYDKTATYTISVLFLSGNEPFETTCYVDNDISKEPLKDDDNDNWISYNRLDEKIGDHYVSAVQYDSKGNPVICPIFNTPEYYRIEEDEIMLSDIDGDGKAEFITTNLAFGGPTIVYKLIEGKPVEVYRITTG